MNAPARFRVYGDFNCPFCHALDEHLHLMDMSEMVSWMPIQHVPDARSDQLSFETLCELTEEVTEVRRRAPTAEIAIPSFRPNTGPASERLTIAGLTDPAGAARLRRLIYRAYWVYGRDISDPRVLRELESEAGLVALEGGDVRAAKLLRRWQVEWERGPFSRRTPVSVAANDATLVGFPMGEIEAFFRSGSPHSSIESGAVCVMKPRQRIIVLDRDASSIRAIISALPDYDIEVLTDRESLAARLGTSTPVDLMLLDLAELGDGWAERAPDLCASLPAPQPPLILAGRDSGGELESAVFAAGAADFLAKPYYRPDILNARLRMHLQMRRSQELLRDLARTDSLTELYNRREFDLQLQLEWERATRSHTPLSVLIVDIDHFKQYNDHYGHGYGDECLRRVAAVLRQCLRRPTDLLARYGGEEFAGVLPDTSGDGVRLVAERCRAAIEAEGIPHAHSPTAACLTISVGTASSRPERGALAHELLEAADRCLYEAKRSGRNRVVSASSTD